MKLAVYKKVINHNSFEVKYNWTFKKGWYDDGERQYIVTFEHVKEISSFMKNYYRFLLYGQPSTNTYYWLILSPFKNLIFLITQYGFIKVVLSPIKKVASLFNTIKTI